MILISIIITTFNRKNVLKENLKLYEKAFKNNNEIELIVSDDNSKDGTKELVLQEFPFVSYTLNQTGQGYSKNLLNGISHARGEYFINLSDDDTLIDPTYITDVIKRLKEKNPSQIYFARIEQQRGQKITREHFDFVQEYSNKQFLSDWFKFRDYIGFSTFIFKKSLFLKCNAFESKIPFVYAPDWMAILKCALNSNKIVFIDKFVYRWIETNQQQISKQHRQNMIIEIMNYMSSPYELLNEFKHTPDIPSTFILNWINKEVNYLLEAIKSNYHLSHNELIFKYIFDNLDLEKYNNIFIYGGGDAGSALEEYLISKSINITAIVDDNKDEKTYISFNEFLKLSDENDLIIIATYKYRLLYYIYKKIRNNSKINIIDLFENDFFPIINQVENNYE